MRRVQSVGQKWQPGVYPFNVRALAQRDASWLIRRASVLGW